MKELGTRYTEENSYYHHGRPEIHAMPALSFHEKPTVAELFCGCGGTSLGFEMAGYELLLGMDIHQPSIQTFATNHRNAATILGDIRKVSPENVQNAIHHVPVDVLIGGVPCQGFSLSNKKRRVDDHRNFLYLEFMRFVSALRPKAIVMENVSGMKSAKDGAFVEHILRDLEASGGYKASCQILNAADYGVPQKRQRLIFVAVKGKHPFDFASVQKTNGEGMGKPYLTVRDAISDLPSLFPGASAKVYTKPPQTDYQKLMRKHVGKALTCHTAPHHAASCLERIRRTKPGQPLYDSFRQRIRLAWDIPSPTQVSGGIRPQFQFAHPEDDRGLTIRERCRLQSFPDNFLVTGGIVQGRVQTGNAVPPLLAKAIAEALLPYIMTHETDKEIVP